MLADRVASMPARRGHPTLRDLLKLTPTDPQGDHEVDGMAAGAGFAGDDIERHALMGWKYTDRPEAVADPGGGALVLPDQQGRIPDPGLVDAHETTAVVGPTLGHKPTGTHHDIPLHPGQYPKAVTTERPTARTPER